jgi:hypothetical protein
LTAPELLQNDMAKEGNVDNTTLLIIIIILIVVFGGGFYGRGRWY